MYPLVTEPQARNPVHAAAIAASRHGHRLSADAADQVAAAVLAYSDETKSVTEQMPREFWESIPDADGYWKHMAYRLHEEVAESGSVPVSLPERSVRRISGVPWLQGEVPMGAAWDWVELRLSVPVRKVAP